MACYACCAMVPQLFIFASIGKDSPPWLWIEAEQSIYVDVSRKAEYFICRREEFYSVRWTDQGTAYP
eukprot:scaffold7198_cov150-Skeletonema_menzelii.AAC.15